MAAFIHDLGKISVPAEILCKPTLLRKPELELLRDHPRAGYDILKDIAFPWPIARIVLEHHEKLDGSGYPNGLSGDDILLESRIVTVADVVESMASHRPYRPSRDSTQRSPKSSEQGDMVRRSGRRRLPAPDSGEGLPFSRDLIRCGAPTISCGRCASTDARPSP
jgi:hypothetical protein